MFKFRRNKSIGRHRAPNVGPNAIVTYGFDENEGHTVHLHYTERLQPDVAGALAFSYDLYALPLYNVAGPFMTYRHQFRTVTPAPNYFQQAPITGMGGLYAGTFAFQPLLDPNNPNGFDVNDI